MGDIPEPLSNPGERALGAAWTPVRLKDGGTYPYGFGWDLGVNEATPESAIPDPGRGLNRYLRYPEYGFTMSCWPTWRRLSLGLSCRA